MTTNYHTAIDGTCYYNKSSEIESRFSDLDSGITGKADSSHDHTESDITDLDKYTQAEVDSLLTNLDKYTQAEVDALLTDQPYDIGGTFNGTPTDDLVLLRYPMPRTVTFPVGLAASKMIAGTAATASTVFSLKKNNTEFGSATFAVSGTSATFAAASETSFSAGDILTIVAPATADTTLANLGWAIVGSR